MNVGSSTFPFLPIPPEATHIESRHETALLSVTGAARLLGVHPNTVRAWTDQGRLRCLRINARGDRRYREVDLQSFLHEAGLNASPFKPFVSRFRETAPPATVTDVAPTEEREERPERPQREPAAGASANELAASIKAQLAVRLASDSVVAGEHSLVRQIRDQLRAEQDLNSALRGAALAVLATSRFRAVAIAESRDGDIVPMIHEGMDARSTLVERADRNLVALCLREGRSVTVPTSVPPNGRPGRPPATLTIYSPIGPTTKQRGVVIVESASERPLSNQDLSLLDSFCGTVEIIWGQAALAAVLAAQQRRWDDLASITSDLSSQLDMAAVLRMLVTRSLSMFHADRGAVLRVVDGQTIVEAGQNLSNEYVEALRALHQPPPGVLGATGGKTVILRNLATNTDIDDDLKAAIANEGYQTAALIPLVADAELIGVLGVYHDRTYAWSPQDVDLLESLGTQAGIALRNVKNYQLMATWAAQLQSIQQLGTKLNRWGTVAAIGQAIASELRQLIDYHNVRVYRVHGTVVEPVAWRGEIGEYTDEERDQLRLTVGEGITGWVAQNGIPQYLPDAANDPRSQTIPGTEAELDESMLIAPMLYEDQVLGVIVLSKLGLNQFTGDDLRYLEIYASIAAQAMVNADATEQLKAQSDRLARQLISQRELMQVTESILSTLDPHAVVEEIADRLGGLIRVDNIAIGMLDENEQVVRTIFARGADAEMYMNVVMKAHEGLGGWVLTHGEAVLIPNTLDDSRYLTFEDRAIAASVIVAPLRSRDKVTGMLLLERLGVDAVFGDEEFELLKLFAGHVSIALQNAEAHHAVEIRAQTDALTGLKNQGTFQEYLQVTVKRGNPFSLLIVDLDDFKSFNDRRGHEAGNVMLANIAIALRSSCRESDEVFRYGGDEFALILPNTDEEGAMRVAAKVGRAVRNAPAPGTRRASGVTCSIGVAAFPLDASDRESILLAADRACYVAKRDGRNRAVTAADAVALAGNVLPDGPTPVDDPRVTADAA